MAGATKLGFCNGYNLHRLRARKFTDFNRKAIKILSVRARRRSPARGRMSLGTPLCAGTGTGTGKCMSIQLAIALALIAGPPAVGVGCVAHAQAWQEPPTRLDTREHDVVLACGHGYTVSYTHATQ